MFANYVSLPQEFDYFRPQGANWGGQGEPIFLFSGNEWSAQLDEANKYFYNPVKWTDWDIENYHGTVCLPLKLSSLQCFHSNNARGC